MTLFGGKESEPWPKIRFQPLLFAALWVATFHVATIPGGGRFGMEQLVGGLWEWWLALSLGCPPLLLLSWWMIERCSGVWRYRGMFLRIGADVGQFLALVAFLWARIASTDPLTDARLYAWIVLSGCALFLLLCTERDSAMLIKTEQIARENRKAAADVEH